jgi:uncharacterized protein (TIGR02217 family)
MGAFLEERLPVNVRLGASYADGYSVEITTTASGVEYRKLTHPRPVRSGNINFTMLRSDLAEQVIGLYHRAYGSYAGFRVKCLDDFSTYSDTGVPTAFDFTALPVSTGVYQLCKGYGSGGTPLGIGLPYRKIFKPVAGSVLVGVNSVVPTLGWSVDTTTGLVTFSANKTGNITGITKASQAVINIPGHALVSGESVHVSNVSGMTQINGQRGLIVSVVAGTSITVAINTSSYGTYTSGGTVNTRPQSGESVTAGCYFDLPFRFNSKIEVTSLSPDVRDCGGVDILELVAP